ncbi:MAG: serine hydrolase domain-containing protein [Bacteroidota bacterium]
MSYKTQSNCLKFSSLLLLLLFLQPAFSQYNFGAVDELLAKNKKLLGGDVITRIYKDGKLIYNNQTNKEFTGKTQAPIANSSQWLTAALTMIYVNEGKISLDDPVTKYIPIFTSYSKRYITIRQCLSHTTGIHAEAPGLKAVLQNKKYSTLEDEATGIAKKEIERNPGEIFFYSDIGLDIVGRILEIVSKKTFDRIIAERLLRPLKMRQTSFYVDYDKAVNPSAGAVSTANDYMNFLSMILNKGMFEGKRILSEKSIAEMQKIQTGNAAIKYQPALTLGYGYGLGVWIREKDAAGAGTVITNPGIYGTYPLVDFCRGYACLLFVRTLQNEQKKELYDSLVDAINQQLSSNCQ